MPVATPQQEILEIPVAGADGAAVGEKITRQIAYGRFSGVYLEYTGQPATCVVTLTELGTGLVIGSITGNTNGIFLLFLRYPLYGRIKVDVSLGNAGSVKAILRWGYPD